MTRANWTISLRKLKKLYREHATNYSESMKSKSRFTSWSQTAIIFRYTYLLDLLAQEEPTFPLVDIPDNQLSEAERKEKRKQLAAKSLHESRQRQREAKELARKQQVAYL